MEDLLKLISGFAIAIVTSYITVQLSLKRFRAERWWDKKALAYERIIEAFHNSKKFSSEHLDAEYEGGRLSEERDKELRLMSNVAKEEIYKASDIGAFIISEKAIEIISNYQKESSSSNPETWVEHLESDYEIVNKYMKLIISEAKSDLKS